MLFFVNLTMALTSAFSNAADANERNLYERPGRTVENYLQILDEAAPKEDILKFSDGTSFAVKGPHFLGQGNFTRIFALKDGRALRVPRPKNSANLAEATGLLYSFALGYNILQARGVPVPQLFEIGSLNDFSETAEYAVVEKIPVIETLHQWLMRQSSSPGKSDPQWLALMDFARATKDFAAFGDFGSFGDHQVVWTGKRWMLVDWNQHHALARPRSTETVFSQLISSPDLRSHWQKTLVKQLIESAVRARLEAEPTIMPRGPVFTFSDGARFQAMRNQPLGQGGSAVIWELSGGRALRIPKIEDSPGAIKSNKALLHSFVQGHQLLNRHAAPIPKLLQVGPSLKEHGPLGLEYVIVEKIADITEASSARPLTLASWERKQRWGKKIDPVFEHAFMEFAIRLAPFASIGDFSSDQILWSGTQWVLVDWFLEGTVLAKAPTDLSPITNLKSKLHIQAIPELFALYAKAEAASRNARAGGGAICEETLSSRISTLDAFGFNALPESDSKSYDRIPRRRE